ncbi:unnamed protein product, partial [Vitis vinifera]
MHEGLENGSILHLLDYMKRNELKVTSNEELILEDLPIEISANEPENQLKQMEHMLPASTSKLKVYLRKGKSATSSHISSSNFLSSGFLWCMQGVY